MNISNDEKSKETTAKDIDYFVYGLMRSGNHSIINWILLHFKSFIFYNCCSVKGDGTVSAENWNIQRFGEEPYEIRLASFEDELYGVHITHDLIPKMGNIIILRDFYNTYASRFQKRRTETSRYWQEKSWYRYDHVDIWKHFAREFLGDTNHTSAIKVNYNMWFSSKEYRKSISSNFGIFSDIGLERVLNIGGGSSFDLLKYDGRAQEMKVLRRWTRYYNDREYAKKVLGDSEARGLNQRIFSFAPPRIIHL